LLATVNIANNTTPVNSLPAQASTVDVYNDSASSFAAMAPQSISAVGGSQPHTNFQPYLCVNFIISLYGIFPSPT
jgi:microcystin-dependent protein